MALTTSERQARYRKRLKQKARDGVTPEMVIRAARLVYEAAVKYDVPRPNEKPNTWATYLDHCRQKRGREMWRENLLSMTADSEDYDGGFTDEERDLLVRVGAVLEVISKPPTD